MIIKKVKVIIEEVKMTILILKMMFQKLKKYQSYF